MADKLRRAWYWLLDEITYAFGWPRPPEWTKLNNRRNETSGDEQHGEAIAKPVGTSRVTILIATRRRILMESGARTCIAISAMGPIDGSTRALQNWR